MFLISLVNVLGKLADVLILILGQMPTVLLLLNANDVNLTIASAANMPFYSFILIGVVRRVIEDCLYFFSGRWYGKDIVAHLTKENRRSKWLKVSKAKVREKRTLDAPIRSRHFTRLTGSVDVLRVRNGKKRQSEANVFVFRFFRRGSAGGFVSSGGERREEGARVERGAIPRGGRDEI